MTRPALTYIVLAVAVLALLLYGMTFASRLSPSARLELNANTAHDAAELFWTVGDSASDIHGWEYRKRLSDGPYESPNDGWTSLPQSAGRDGRYRAVNLTNGLVYIFQVRQTGEIREDEWSNQLAVVPTADPGVVPPESEFCSGEELGEILFAFDSHEIDMDFQDNRGALTTIVRGLRSEGAAKRALATGYASAGGKASYNLDLSEERTIGVIKYLEERVEVELAALAMGERHEEWVLDGADERHQKVIVKSCRTEAVE